MPGGETPGDVGLRADDLLPALDGLAEKPLRDHVVAFESVHRRLVEALDEAAG
ncbi:hypothetical protein [Beutenbergia cavernae]|uniref:hypothetical protein n=1 Tax=Beutenbergia cavernae TaxID=84757 RepID=UPI00019AC2A1|nr:hypothetical protein [Beutenbergia cavernae]